MFVKYLENIHDLENYESYVKVGGVEILLVGFHDTALVFQDLETRNWALFHIWDQLKSGEKFLDLDMDVEIYHNSEKYKI
jgi:hypothetical protein